MISSQEVLKLRAETGAGVMDCQKALEEARGDFDKAKKILANNAQAVAEKKSARPARHGLIECYSHLDKIGVVLEIACESDFVARNQEFKNLAHNIAMQIASMNPQNIEELFNQKYIKDETLTTSDLLNQAISKIGENIQIKRFVRYELGEE